MCIRDRSSIVRYNALASLIRLFQMEGQNIDYPIHLLEQVCGAVAASSDSVFDNACKHLLAEQYLFQKRFDDFKRTLSTQDTSTYGLQLWAAHAFLSGDNQRAIEYFEKALLAKNKLTKRKKPYLNEVLGYFYKLALLIQANQSEASYFGACLLYTSPSPRDLSTSRMPSSA